MGHFQQLIQAVRQINKYRVREKHDALSETCLIYSAKSVIHSFIWGSQFRLDEPLHRMSGKALFRCFLKLKHCLHCRFDSPQAKWSQTRGALGSISSWRNDTCCRTVRWGREPCRCTLAHRRSTGRTARTDMERAESRVSLKRSCALKYSLLCSYTERHQRKGGFKCENTWTLTENYGKVNLNAA